MRSWSTALFNQANEAFQERVDKFSKAEKFGLFVSGIARVSIERIQSLLVHSPGSHFGKKVQIIAIPDQKL